MGEFIMNKDMDKPIGSVFVSKDEKERMNNMNCDKPIATISPFRYMNKKSQQKLLMMSTMIILKTMNTIQVFKRVILVVKH